MSGRMSRSSSSGCSSMPQSRRASGVPTRCWCGEGVIPMTSRTDENPYRRFYRCPMGLKDKQEKHLFQWVDEALLEEIRMVEMKHTRLANDVKEMERKMESTMETHLLRLQKMEEKFLEKMEEEVKQNMAEKFEADVNKMMVSLSVKMVVVSFVVSGVVAWYYRK